MKPEANVEAPDSIVPEKILSLNSPAKDLQAQADSVPRIVSGDNGPPKNLQSLPTQDTDPVNVGDADSGSALEYECPICSQKIPKNLTLFLEHGKQHVISSIRQAHPEWVDQDGLCIKCVVHYEEAMQAGVVESCDISVP